MKYPENFKAKVKKVYPNNIKIVNEVEKDVSISLLDLLNEENLKISTSIVEIKDYSINELRKRQKIVFERMEIYNEYFDIYNKATLG